MSIVTQTQMHVQVLKPSPQVLAATLKKFPNLDPAKIDDVCIGTVLAELGGSKAGRMAANHVGYRPPRPSAPSTVLAHLVSAP
jgi:acetyl-CoA acetyltransferase